eukprot:8774860-Pyramimonas_sp.AAC.1
MSASDCRSLPNASNADAFAAAAAASAAAARARSASTSPHTYERMPHQFVRICVRIVTVTVLRFTGPPVQKTARHSLWGVECTLAVIGTGGP